MPCILKIRVLSARDLPVMDKATELADAYVEVRFSDYEVQRTQICRKTLNPVWNAEFRFEVSDDSELQNEPVEFRVLDYDAISSNDPIGNVFVDMNPLLTWEASSIMEDPVLTKPESERQISGWFPLYDTLLGIRGEVQILLKLQFFGDVNPFKDSSAGVSLFSSPRIPTGFAVDQLYGLVEVLVTENDPEFSWADTFRAPRTSNDSRQKLLYRLSGQLRRLIGKEVLEMEGNAVVGYQQTFDIEKEGGILTARAVGTCVSLVRSRVVEESALEGTMHHAIDEATRSDILMSNLSLNSSGFLDTYESTADKSGGRKDSGKSPISPNPMTSDSPISPDAGTVKGADYAPSRNNSIKPHSPRKPHPHFATPMDPILLTIDALPEFSVTRIGGVVSSKSVKLYQSNDEELRKNWWWELREEIIGHAKQLKCQYVMGYTESATFRDELCVLSAVGTAVCLDRKVFHSSIFHDGDERHLNTAIEEESESVISERDGAKEDDDKTVHSTKTGGTLDFPRRCFPCHLPDDNVVPFPISVTKCAICGTKNVPEVILSTIEAPDELDIVGHTQFVEAQVCRPKKHKEGESNAAIVSDSLPFIEYDLNRQLIYKMRVFGLNSIFGLQFNMALHDGWIVAVASGTGACLAALPPPIPLRISRNIDTIDLEDRKLVEIQNQLMDFSRANHGVIEAKRADFFNRLQDSLDKENSSAPMSPLTPSDDTPAFERLRQHRQRSPSPISENIAPTTAVVVQVDDDVDEDLMAALLEPTYPDTFTISNLRSFCRIHDLLSELCVITEKIRESSINGQGKTPKICMQSFTVFKQADIGDGLSHPNAYLASIFRDLYASIFVNTDVFISTHFCGVSLGIGMPEDGLLHLTVSGMMVSTYLVDEKDLNKKKNLLSQGSGGELNDFSVKDSAEHVNRQKQMESIFEATYTSSAHPFVDITALPEVPFKTTVSYQGRLSLQFVKEDQNLNHLFGSHFTEVGGLEEAADDDLGRFIQIWIMEIYALVRAHTVALGGNAVVSFRIENSEFRQPVKNQGYGMVSIGADVVRVVQGPEDSLSFSTWDEMVEQIWSNTIAAGR